MNSILGIRLSEMGSAWLRVTQPIPPFGMKIREMPRMFVNGKEVASVTKLSVCSAVDYQFKQGDRVEIIYTPSRVAS